MVTDSTTNSTADATAYSKPNHSRYIVIGLIIVLGLGLLYLLFGSSRTQAEPSTISGEIDFNGISPADAKNPSLGKITLLAREHDSSTEYTDTGITIPFEDRSTWNWETADSGKSYDLKAQTFYKGVLIKESMPVVATAPATNIRIVFNITSADIPEEIRDATPVEPSTTVVSGVITINGFIPTGSTVNIYARIAGTEDKFVEAISDIPAKNGVVFEAENAIAGETYEYQAELYTANGTFIGQSAYLTVTAPAANEVIIINSTATTPTTSATISGTITLNGPFEQNSTVIVLQRKSGDTEFTLIDRYPATRSVDFSWADAQSGVAYDISSALQVNEANTATGNVVTVTAPAAGVRLLIDSNFNLTPPNQTPSVSCGDPDGTNHFNAQVSLPQMQDAKKYYLEVGTSAGANNTFKGTIQPNTSATVYIPADSPNFTRYAYTACTDCDIADTSNWSGWSPTLGFQCPQN
jgi:hypothetical protein